MADFQFFQFSGYININNMDFADYPNIGYVYDFVTHHPTR